MKKNKLLKKWRYIFVGVVFLYVISIILGFYLISKVPKMYSNIQETTFINAKESINEALKNDDKNALKNIENDVFSDFMIFKNKNILYYGTLNITKPEEIGIFRDKKDVALEELYTLNINGENYDVWIAQYYIKAQNLYNFIILGLMIFTTVLISALVIGITILFFNFLKPLKTLKNNILKISTYRLDEIKGDQKINEADFLSLELENFAKDLNSKMKNTEITYTALEYDLTHKNELMSKRSKMIATLTHDLKTPLQSAVLQFESLNFDYNDERINKGITALLKVMEELKDITKVAYSDNVASLKENSRFDLIELLEENIENFTFLLQNKNIETDYEFDESIKLVHNKILFKQLIHNAFSNICAYTKEFGKANIKCYIENNEIFLSFYNDSQKLSEEDLKNSFNLFHRVSDDSIGTGTGLYTIKSIVSELSGKVYFENYDNGVILKIFIPMVQS